MSSMFVCPMEAASPLFASVLQPLSCAPKPLLTRDYSYISSDYTESALGYLETILTPNNPTHTSPHTPIPRCEMRSWSRGGISWQNGSNRHVSDYVNQGDDPTVCLDGGDDDPFPTYPHETTNVSENLVPAIASYLPCFLYSPGAV